MMYSIEKHGDSYALYSGRVYDGLNSTHGLNLGTIDGCHNDEQRQHLVDLLNGSEVKDKRIAELEKMVAHLNSEIESLNIDMYGCPEGDAEDDRVARDRDLAYKRTEEIMNSRK